MSKEKEKIICAFDIGIKNLAFCVFDTGSKQPLAWANVNILPETEKVAPTSCSKCKAKAKYILPNAIGNSVEVCKKHLGVSIILPGGETKIPAAATLKTLCKSNGLQASGTKKEDLLAALKTKFATPIETPKKVAATHQPMAVLHDGILKMITDNWTTFQKVNQFALENQPVLKNPTMKTVQILLYASLRSAFLSRGLKAPDVDLVHASKKVQGAAVGDEGYSERKAGSEARAETWLKANATGWLKVLTDAKKKSDLADALCMCLDLSAKN